MLYYSSYYSYINSRNHFYLVVSYLKISLLKFSTVQACCFTTRKL